MLTENPAVITAIVSVISLLIIAAGGAYWLGRLSNRVDRLEEKVDQLDAKVDRMDAKFDQRLIELRSELREEIRQLDEKVDRRFDELRSELLEEMRRGNQQLLLALANHRHDDDGYPVFRMPVAAE